MGLKEEGNALGPLFYGVREMVMEDNDSDQLLL